jgi:hypothetical protein
MHFAHEKNINLSNYPTTEIHDRVWIKNSGQAKLVGTSFGGLSHKLAFIVDLPQDDVVLFMHELYRIQQNLYPK